MCVWGGSLYVCGWVSVCVGGEVPVWGEVSDAPSSLMRTPALWSQDPTLMT